eukprot:TRINITY_DN105579_c0_g1_i1.p1 TRINITY_DN105579_c0_g1~~TRINITY_DN105579_c0_g1_i1.p1  ORF type:complete len:349 (-),score=54.26 TRINITY_DN105579_c0_g1_i1:22-1005(-)
MALPRGDELHFFHRRLSGLRPAWLAIALLLLLDSCRMPFDAKAFAVRSQMSIPEAWSTLQIPTTSTKGEVKRAFKERIREVHPDVTGDDGAMLRKVQDAFRLIDSLKDPETWTSDMENGLPDWAADLMQGIKWSPDCSSYAVFLEKPDHKALAVGERSESTGLRPWAAAWGKHSQQDANTEALRICRQHGTKCRLVYVGSGSTRMRPTGLSSAAPEAERAWWQKQFKYAGESPGFGWMPTINPDKEKLVGYKTVDGGTFFDQSRVRVPVFEPLHGGIPYFYSPAKPGQKILMKRTPFKRLKSIAGDKKNWKLKDSINRLNQPYDGWD